MAQTRSKGSATQKYYRYLTQLSTSKHQKDRIPIPTYLFGPSVMIWLAEEIQFPIMKHTLISKETKNNEEKGKSLSFFLSNSAHIGTQNITGEAPLSAAQCVPPRWTHHTESLFPGCPSPARATHRMPIDMIPSSLRFQLVTDVGADQTSRHCREAGTSADPRSRRSGSVVSSTRGLYGRFRACG